MENSSYYRFQHSPSHIIHIENRPPIKISRTDSSHEMPWSQIKTPSQQVNCRYHHSSILFQDILYVYGGFENNNGILSDFKMFRNFKNKAQWKNLPTVNGPGPRHSHSAIGYNSEIYIFGGKVNIMDNTNQIFAFNIEEQCWRKIQPINEEDGPPPTDSHQCILYKDEMLVIGGFTNNKHTNDIYGFHLTSLIWRLIYKTGENVNEPQPRSDFSLVERDSNLYIFGGKNSNQLFCDFWKFDLNECKFSEIEIENNCVEGRSGHSAILYLNKMIIFGGISGVTHERNDLLSYNFKTNKWKVVWENSQKYHPSMDDFEAGKLNSSKKNSINTKMRGIQKSKTLCRKAFPSTFEEKKKYRRTLKEEMMENEARKTRTEGERFKKYNEKKMMLLSEFESNSDEKFSETSFSPLIQTLSNSIMLTSNQNSSHKPIANLEAYGYGKKILRPRDGHSANLFEEKKMIIFGGDRHTIGYNDVIIIFLDQIFPEND